VARARPRGAHPAGARPVWDIGRVTFALMGT
jgi:hypothetical protein